jgi:hypothetical protein
VKSDNRIALVRCALGVLALCIASRVFAGDAVAVGYNAEGIWTAVTNYCSSTPKGGRDYKTEKEAREIAVRDVRRRSEHRVAKASVLSSSDSTGFVTVARGTDESGKDTIVIGRGKSQTEADNSTLELLNAASVGAERKIVYRYFFHGADSK